MSEFERSVRAWFDDGTDKNWEYMADLVPVRAKTEVEKAAKEMINATAWTLKHERAFDKLSSLLNQ